MDGFKEISINSSGLSVFFFIAEHEITEVKLLNGFKSSEDFDKRLY